MTSAEVEHEYGVIGFLNEHSTARFGLFMLILLLVARACSDNDDTQGTFYLSSYHEQNALVSYETNGILYVLQPGDTLWSISTQFGVPIPRIVQVNALSDPNIIVAGTTLVIPPA